jgi:hypothetical protein
VEKDIYFDIIIRTKSLGFSPGKTALRQEQSQNLEICLQAEIGIFRLAWEV